MIYPEMFDIIVLVDYNALCRCSSRSDLPKGMCVLHGRLEGFLGEEMYTHVPNPSPNPTAHIVITLVSTEQLHLPPRHGSRGDCSDIIYASE